MHPHLPERRRGYRKQASSLASLRPVQGDGTALDAHVFDLSSYGAGMSVTHPIEPGAVLHFEMLDGRQSGSRIEIKSCRPRADKMFDVGGQFC
jgi:hypothetical protein